MKKTVSFLMILLCCIAGRTTLAQDAAPKPLAHSQKRIGILLLAHGGSALEWDEDVRHVADQTDLTIPTEVAFGMATRSSIQAAIHRLVARRVTEIVAVPLFVSSHSSVIDSIAYLLGARMQAPEDLKMFAKMDNGSGGMAMDRGSMSTDRPMTTDASRPVLSPVPIHMASALDHHRIVAEILRDRAASISQDPAHEVVLLVAHGPVPDDENKPWLADMSLLAGQLSHMSQYAGIDYLTLRDDADKTVRDAATRQLRQKVERISEGGNTALIVPLLLSYGGIEGGLRERLNGLSYRMAPQGLLPDRRIVDWVIATAQAGKSAN